MITPDGTLTITEKMLAIIVSVGGGSILGFFGLKTMVAKIKERQERQEVEQIRIFRRLEKVESAAPRLSVLESKVEQVERSLESHGSTLREIQKNTGDMAESLAFIKGKMTKSA